MATKTPGRKMIEIDRKRVPLKSLLHGKEIRVAAQALEDYRLKLNEAEILYGAKLTLVMDTYGACTVVAKRLETDSEYQKRLEDIRLAAEAKVEREKKKAIAAEAKKERMIVEQKQRAIESLKNLAKANSLTASDLTSIMESLK
jgi:hypothetical protein